MRVISGTAKGLKLKVPKGLAVRPTADRVKESLFNIINPVIVEAQVLDLFAGTGALGIEALSRGAKFATFIDNCLESIAIIKHNLQHTGLLDFAEVIHANFEYGLKRAAGMQRIYDIIFIDPPYGRGLEFKAVEVLIKYNLVSKNGLLIIETDRKNQLPDKLYDMIKVDIREYGGTVLNFYKWS